MDSGVAGWQAIAEIASNLSVVGLLLGVAYLFYRGDLLSRKVVQELSEKLVADMAARVIEGVDALCSARLEGHLDEYHHE